MKICDGKIEERKYLKEKYKDEYKHADIKA